MKSSLNRKLAGVLLWSTNTRLAMLAIIVFIGCAMIGGPVIGSVERSNHHKLGAGVAGNGGKATRAVTLQDDEKAQPAAKTGPEEFYEIPYTGAKPPAKLPRPEHPISTFSAVQIAEVEPNNTSATAQPLGATSARIKGNIYPAGDVDY